MPDEKQRANHEATQGKQKPPSKSVAKLRYRPAYWVTFVLLMLAIIAVEWLFIGRGTIMVMIGPLVAGLLAWLIASRLFPPVKK
jgi:hypothetical protein